MSFVQTFQITGHTMPHFALELIESNVWKLKEWCPGIYISSARPTGATRVNQKSNFCEVV